MFSYSVSFPPHLVVSIYGHYKIVICLSAYFMDTALITRSHCPIQHCVKYSVENVLLNNLGNKCYVKVSQCLFSSIA